MPTAQTVSRWPVTAETPDPPGVKVDEVAVGQASADPYVRAVLDVRLRPLASWDCGFESRRRHGCLCLVNVVLSGRGLLPSLVFLSVIEKPR